MPLTFRFSLLKVAAFLLCRAFFFCGYLSFRRSMFPIHCYKPAKSLLLKAVTHNFLLCTIFYPSPYTSYIHTLCRATCLQDKRPSSLTSSGFQPQRAVYHYNSNLMRTLFIHHTVLLLIFSWLIQFQPQSVMYVLCTICLYHVQRLNIIICFTLMYAIICLPLLLFFYLANHFLTSYFRKCFSSEKWGNTAY